MEFFEDQGLVPPIITIRDVLLVPLQVDITDRAVQIMQEEILEQIMIKKIRYLVLDVRALDVIDSFLARMLVTTLKRASLMGVKGFLSGIRPHVAITLVHMGLERLKLYDVDIVSKIDDILDLGRQS